MEACSTSSPATVTQGILVINVWENEGRQAMAAEPEIHEALTAGGFPLPGFEGYEILAIRTSDRIADFATATF